VVVRVGEVERPDAGGPLVPGREGLRFCGDEGDVVLAQPLVRPIHVGDHDRDVLEAAIVAVTVGRDGTAAGGQELGQHDCLLAQDQSGAAHVGAEDAGQSLQRRAR